MEDRTDVSISQGRAPRMTRIDEIEEEPHEEAHGRERMREMLQQRERATERFRALKRRLLARR